MNTPHKYAEITIAWLNDQSIKLEYRLPNWDRWAVSSPQGFGMNPITHPLYEWRIKPEPKPDVVRLIDCWKDSLGLAFRVKTIANNLKLTFDGETGKLKSAEVI
jgi:hypothetical protein